MKIKELTQEDTGPGTFAGVRFSKETQKHIKEFCEQNNIQNALPTEKLHVTLLYSRKPCPNYEPNQNSYPMTATPKGFEIWKSEHIEGKPNCLVLKLDCPDLVDRHNELMQEHDATFDYPEYKTHVTFSYDVGDLKAEDIPSFDADLDIVSEYKEDLRTEYKANELT